MSGYFSADNGDFNGVALEFRCCIKCGETELVRVGFSYT